MTATEKRRIYPCDLSSPAAALPDFAREAAAVLAPDLELEWTVVAESSSEAPYDFSEQRRRHGSETAGCEVVERVDYYEGGGYLGERRSVGVRSYGLPEGAALHLSFCNQVLTLEVSAAADRALAVALACEARFSAEPSRELLDTLSSRARSWLARGQWGRAIEDARIVLARRPADRDALLALGAASSALGEREEAERALRALIQRDPRHVDGQYNLGNLYADRGDWGAAARRYRAALAADPDNHPAAYQLGRALEAAGRKPEALEAYRRAVRASPNPLGAWGYRGMDFTPEAEKAVARLEAPPGSGGG
jgi:tetratricopeptide (TPR) repeat protein